MPHQQATTGTLFEIESTVKSAEARSYVHNPGFTLAEL